MLGLLIEHSKVYGESLEELEALGRQLLGGDDDDVATKGEILQDNIGDIEHLMKRFGGEVEDDNLIETTFKSREPSENKDSCKKMLAARNRKYLEASKSEILNDCKVLNEQSGVLFNCNSANYIYIHAS